MHVDETHAVGPSSRPAARALATVACRLSPSSPSSATPLNIVATEFAARSTDRSRPDRGGPAHDEYVINRSGVIEVGIGLLAHDLRARGLIGNTRPL